jgi:hypothetical protein
MGDGGSKACHQPLAMATPHRFSGTARLPSGTAPDGFEIEK